MRFPAVASFVKAQEGLQITYPGPIFHILFIPDFHSNEFYIVGPKDDPAGIAGTESAAEAYQKIADAKSKFFSRGDNSGTHKKEMDAWKMAGIEPSGDWYIITKDFMMATLKREVCGVYLITIKVLDARRRGAGRL